MSRPTLEVADILRVAGSSFVARYGSHLAPQHRKVMDARPLPHGGCLAN